FAIQFQCTARNGVQTRPGIALCYPGPVLLPDDKPAGTGDASRFLSPSVGCRRLDLRKLCGGRSTYTAPFSASRSDTGADTVRRTEGDQRHPGQADENARRSESLLARSAG